MNKETDLPQTLNTKNSAIYLGVSPDMLRLSRHTGYLFKGVAPPPYLKIGSAVRYRRDDLERWLDSQKKYHNTAEVLLSKIEDGSL